MSERPYGAPGGAHSFSTTHYTVEESTKHILEAKARDRLVEGSHAFREQQHVRAAIDKAKKAKERRRARNPYDFG
jgi:hypothetical protein